MPRVARVAGRRKSFPGRGCLDRNKISDQSENGNLSVYIPELEQAPTDSRTSHTAATRRNTQNPQSLGHREDQEVGTPNGPQDENSKVVEMFTLLQEKRLKRDQAFVNDLTSLRKNISAAHHKLNKQAHAAYQQINQQLDAVCTRLEVSLKEREDSYEQKLEDMKKAHELNLAAEKERIHEQYERRLAESTQVMRENKELNKEQMEKGAELKGHKDQQDIIQKQLVEVETYKMLTMCQTCMMKPRDVVILPCMHLCICSDCLHRNQVQNSTKVCLICKCNISGTIECSLKD